MLYNNILRLLMYCVIIAREKQVISYDHMSESEVVTNIFVRLVCWER